MKKIFLILTLICAFSSIACAEEIYLGKDNRGSTWYLDTSTVSSHNNENNFEDKEVEFLDFYITTYELLPYKQEIINIYMKKTNSKRKANTLFNSTYQMSQRYVVELKNNAFCFTNLDFYNSKGETIHSDFFGIALNDWYPLSGATMPLKNAINWIQKNKTSDLKSTAKENIDTINEERAAKGLKTTISQGKSQSNKDGDFFLFSIIIIVIFIIIIYESFKPQQSKSEIAPINSRAPNDIDNENVDYIDVEIVEDETQSSFYKQLQKVNENKANDMDSFMSHVTIIEKIILVFMVISLTISLLTLLEILPPLEYSQMDTRQIFISTVLACCSWFSVRYSFYCARKIRNTKGTGTAIFIRCLGIFIAIFIIWAYGYYRILSYYHF